MPSPFRLRRFRASARAAASPSGCRTGAAAASSFSNTNLQKFLEAARKRPELANVNSVWRPDVPQIYADINRDKVLKQGVAVGDVYQTLQAFLGGIYVNQFNRFGRQWKVFLQAEADGRVQPSTTSTSSTCATTTGRWCRSRRS